MTNQLLVEHGQNNVILVNNALTFFLNSDAVWYPKLSTGL